jgi:hypothetical protein
MPGNTARLYGRPSCALSKRRRARTARAHETVPERSSLHETAGAGGVSIRAAPLELSASTLSLGASRTNAGSRISPSSP